ncbi:MAG TPA: hypothetical protein VFZ04_00245 [Longimicrobiales bacterium]
MRKVTFVVAAVLLWTAKPAEATYIYTFDAGGATGSVGSTTPISFSFLHETLGPAHLGGFNWPEINEDCTRGICRSDFLAISLPAHCQISTVMDFRFEVIGRDFANELEMLGFCRNLVTGAPESLFGLVFHWLEPFDHVGTYISGGGPATLTIAEVADVGSTAPMFALGIAALGLRRRIRNPLHH